MLISLRSVDLRFYELRESIRGISEKMLAQTLRARALTRELLENVLDMLDGRYPSQEFGDLRPRIVWDRVGNTIRGRIGRSTYLGEVAEYDFQPRPVSGSGPASAGLKIYELNPRFLEATDDAEITAQAAPDDVVILHP